jgi:hypothetical protein
MILRPYPVSIEYSVAYQSDLRRAIAEIDLLRRVGTLPLAELIERARTVYRQAWAAELERMPV